MGGNFTTFFFYFSLSRGLLFETNLSEWPIEWNWCHQLRTKYYFAENLFWKIFNTNVRPRNFIQNNSTLFWCFTLSKLLHICEQFSFLFTLKKSLSTERLLICPRDETGSLYITRAQTRRRGLQTTAATRINIHSALLSPLVTEFWSYAFCSWTSEHDGDVFVRKNYKSMKFKSMKWSYLSRWTVVVGVHELFPSALQNSDEKSGNSFVSRIRIFEFFFLHRERTLNNFMGRRVFHMRRDF